MSRLRQRLSKIGVAILASAVVLLAMAWLSGTFRSGQVTPAKLTPVTRPASGTLVTVSRTPAPLLAEVVGSVQAEKRATLSARLSASILRMKVDAGDRVRRGDVLIELDDRDWRARVAQAQEALRSAEARRDLTRIELDRVQEMVQKDVASVYELDQWKTNWLTAVADLARAQQAVSEAQVALSDATISAPIDGIVIDRLAEPGDMASPGKPLLTVYDPARLRLEASVREAFIGQLKTNQRLAVFIDAINAERAGVVEQIVPAADPSSRSFLVKVHLEDSTGLYPGMFARMRLPMGERQELLIPESAVRRVGQLTLVDVARDGVAHRRAVRLGQRHDQNVVVLAGLDEGEQVLVDQDHR